MTFAANFITSRAPAFPVAGALSFIRGNPFVIRSTMPNQGEVLVLPSRLARRRCIMLAAEGSGGGMTPIHAPA